MIEAETYLVLAIPLNRPDIVDFLQAATGAPHGTAVAVVGQRPSLAAEAQWMQRLAQAAEPAVADLLAIDAPHNHLRRSHTDRLVPMHFLQEPGFLTRNLGGWSPVYFGVVGLPRAWRQVDDPLLKRAEVLADYGRSLRWFGADAAQVGRRLAAELGQDAAQTAAALRRLYRQRPALLRPDPGAIADYAELVYAHVATGRRFATATAPPIPEPLLLDELMGWLLRLELAQRAAQTRGDAVTAEAVATWQEAQAEATGLRLILKGEYIVGRHRRSTVLIAPELGVVVKQPGPEPFHEIALAARTHDGRAENWPVLTHDQSLVTPRGRLRQVLEEGLILRLHERLAHPMEFYTLLGITVEPFVVGPTTQELVLGDAAALTPALYEVYVLHQQVCEALRVENGDWHAANFVQRQGDGAIVHIDWGAARPLRPEEHTPQGRRARLNQVKNIAYSFQDAALAARVEQMHAALLADDARLARLRRRAEAIAKGENT